jgi:hypothetical protein
VAPALTGFALTVACGKLWKYQLITTAGKKVVAEVTHTQLCKVLTCNDAACACSLCSLCSMICAMQGVAYCGRDGEVTMGRSFMGCYRRWR